ncbi:ribonuclease P protein component [Sulfitobacter sp. HNIBRBA3233]|uniref:ribonuclease P protein component n=1 Tax=Sulfitobacter marinivivus TaxID=3158558 RepID=UPI0032DF708E
MAPSHPLSPGLSPEETQDAAVSSCVPPSTLTKRRDFQRASRARRVAMPGFILQARQRSAGETDTDGLRVGYTCSKKVGNAVARNRAKRRLREAVRLTLPPLARPDHDYVLIGRRDATAHQPFAALCKDIARALAILHADTKA